MPTLREEIETEVSTHVEDFGDLLVQNLNMQLIVPAANLPEALPIEEVVGIHDVLGGAQRYGADEGVILAQKLRSFECGLHGTFTGESTIEIGYELGFDTDAVPSVGRPDQAENISGSAGLNYSEPVNNDVLYYTSGLAKAGFRDTSTGTGGGPEYFQVTDETNYMTDIGVLPEVSARDTLFEYIRLGSETNVDPDDGAIVAVSAWQIYYLETDEEVEGRQIEI